MKSYVKATLLTLACAVAITGNDAIAAPPAKNAATLSSWNKVWTAVRAPRAPMPPPLAANQDGPPVRDRERVLFRFRAPADTSRVYLAGSFNSWAHNKAGVVTDRRFAMRPTGNGMWYRWVDWEAQTHQYKYVVVDKNGGSRWVSDPHIKATDADNNTVLDFATIARSASPRPSAPPRRGRALKPFVPRVNRGVATLESRLDKVWVRPDQPNTLIVTVRRGLIQPDARLKVQVETPLGAVVHTASYPCKGGENRLTIPALRQEGGFQVRVTLLWAGLPVGQGSTVLSSVKNIADDLRYGFYASYANADGDYDARAAMLSRLYINAVEFYDYFPAHGYYAPREEQYKFEPFGTSINALDIQRKIEAGHKRNILSLAYVAAYAASESVYRKYPYPMTDAQGAPRIFNGQIMTEAEANQQKKPKWFWLMNVADDSPWHKYILEEFGRALDDKPEDLVSFDGFEIDTYGDSADTRFYAADSRRNGDLLSNVLRDFVGDVQSLTHTAKPQGLVSFNSVNEFGVEQMYGVTDFLFLEIWRSHADRLEDLVDICFRHRAPRSQRVVLKVYPADMTPGRPAWPATTLRRMLGATMTGGGSLMVVGEPDDKKSEMHALNTLYYPDHRPLPVGNEAILRAYYRQDALLLGYTHGRDVVNTALDVAIPGCITRTFATPSKRALAVQILHVGAEKRWSTDAALPSPKMNQEVTFSLPGGVAPKAVYFVSPDTLALQIPAKLDFQVTGGVLRTLLPELHVHGTLVLQY